MRITTKATPEQVREMFDSVNNGEYGGNLKIEITDLNGVRATRLRVKIGATSGKPGSRRSWSGRRGPWACWHAFRDVILAWLTFDPEATVWTGVATYRGLQGFLDTYESTGDRNVGSLVAPVCFADLCECEEEE